MKVWPSICLPFSSSVVMFGSPAASTRVGNQSLLPKIPFPTLPAGTWPGQRIIAGARKPPSSPIPLLPANGVMPPSGQVNTSAPLSVVNTTIVLLSIPRSFRCCRTAPMTIFGRYAKKTAASRLRSRTAAASAASPKQWRHSQQTERGAPAPLTACSAARWSSRRINVARCRARSRAGCRCYRASAPVRPCWDRAFPCCSPLMGWAWRPRGRRHRAPRLKAGEFLLVQLIGRRPGQPRHLVVMGGRVGGVVRVMVHRRHRRGRCRRWCASTIRSEARATRVRPGHSHRVSGAWVLCPDRTGNRERSSDRNAVYEMLHVHGLAFGCRTGRQGCRRSLCSWAEQHAMQFRPNSGPLRSTATPAGDPVWWTAIPRKATGTRRRSA